jgi:hypothetical protein
MPLRDGSESYSMPPRGEMVTKRRMRVLAGVGAAAAVLSIGAPGVAAAAGANPTNPTVSSLVATPPSLGSSGGAVTLSANVANATTCTFTSNRPVVGAPATLPCSNGAINDNVTVPANAGAHAITYNFRLAVTATRTVHARVAVSVQSGFHIFPEVSFPSLLPLGCTIQTFLPGHRWSDDVGGSGRYSGGAQTITEPLGNKPPAALNGAWSSTGSDYVGAIFVGARPVATITLSLGVTAGC